MLDTDAHFAFRTNSAQRHSTEQLRLHVPKAKALLVFDGARVEGAAHGVGYASASQFSREFKRYLRARPPKHGAYHAASSSWLRQELSVNAHPMRPIVSIECASGHRAHSVRGAPVSSHE